MTRTDSHRLFTSLTPWLAVILLCPLLTFMGTAPPAGAATLRVSVASDGTQANGSSEWCAVNGDGRYIVYSSMASNLVPGDANARRDIFVYDRTTATTQLVSLTTAGLQSDADCRLPHISANGQVVAFESAASNLAPGAAYGRTSAYVHDRVTGVTEIVSLSSAGLPAGGYSGEVRLSGDGRYAVFSSYSGLVSADANGKCDVYIRDRLAGITELVSVASDGTLGDSNSGRPYVSADGRFVAFYSDATTLVPGDTNAQRDVFVRDRLLGITERVSVGTDGSEGNSASGDPSISADGRYVAFVSLAGNFAPDDTNLAHDIFVRDRSLGTTTMVSVTPAGQEGSSISNYPIISADGRYVAFYSMSSNLVAGDTNGRYDVFVRDLQAGVTQRASISSAGVQGNDQSTYGWISGDGQSVSFMSSATNLVDADTNAAADMFVRDLGWNTAPVAGDDSAATDEDTLVSIAVLSNDTDAEANPLTISAVTQPANGSAAINGSNVDYTPAANYNGADTFTYTVSDGNGGTDTATVSVTVNPVNDPPTAADDSAGTDEETAVSIAVLANDADVDGDALAVDSVTQPAHGTAVINGSSVDYTPAEDYSGVDSFTYTVSDGNGETATATVSVGVRAVNDPPVLQAIGDKAVQEGATLAFTLAASDPDSTKLTYAVDPLPTGATLDALMGAFAWTPGAGQAGTYPVTFSVSDGNGGSDTEALTITVTAGNQAPTAAFSFLPVAPSVKDAVAFTDLSTDDGTIVAWAWDFGDGMGTSTLQHPTYHYKFGGKYTVTLVVTDDGGLTAVSTFVLPVDGNTPPGQNVKVEARKDEVWVEFAEVKKSGDTKAEKHSTPPELPPVGFKVLKEEYEEITTTAEYEKAPPSGEPPVKIEKKYDPADVPGGSKNEEKLEMRKYDEVQKEWVPIPKIVDTLEKKVEGKSDSLSWYVIGLPTYRFVGFLPPVGDIDRKPFKAGSTIPIKFCISDQAGVPVTDAVATLAVYYLVAGAEVGEPEVVSTAAGDVGNQFRYSPADDCYTFNLSTKSATFFAPYTYRAVVTLDDGTTHAVDFSLKK